MAKNDFWDLSYRPYTQLKLKILKKYLDFWARVFFSQASKHKNWKEYFVDPDGIKELKKESLEKIVNRKGATDILLNYIKGGVERIAGLTKKKIPEILNQKVSAKDIKTIKCLTDFYGLGIFNKLNATEKQRLKEWTNSLLQSSSLKEIAVFDMPYLHKSDNIYYLLFASRKPVAKKVILSIFKKAKGTTYQRQGRLGIFCEDEFEL